MLPSRRFWDLNIPPEYFCLFINAHFSRNTWIRFWSQTRLFLNTDEERLFNLEFEVFWLVLFACVESVLFRLS